MLNIFKIKYAKSMLISFTIQQILVAASSWFLVDFIQQTSKPQNFQFNSLGIFILVAVSPYIPGFVANYFYHLWIVFGRSYNTQNFLTLIDGQTKWSFDTQKRDNVFALQRENLSLVEETSRFVYLNFPVILNLVFNSIAIGFLLGPSITLGMLAGLAISGLQFLLIPLFTKQTQTEKQESHYRAERSFLSAWQVMTLQNQPFHKKSIQTISDDLQKSESLSKHIYKFEALTNIIVLILSFIPLSLILIYKFKANPLDQIFLMSLGVLLPRILQIFNMSSNLIIAGQSLQALKIKWTSYQERLSLIENSESYAEKPSKNLISIIETQTGANALLENVLQAGTAGRYLLKGANGSGKSTLCLNLKGGNKDVFYLPAKFENPNLNIAGSTGEIKLAELKWLYENRLDYSIILLDEWDANLDAEATKLGDSLIQDISQNCLVFEVRHKEALLPALS